MNTKWQYCLPEQAIELNNLGIVHPITEGIDHPSLAMLDNMQYGLKGYPVFSLSEIAVMLGYTFVPSNVKEACDKLICELKVGSSTAKDCNARLREAYHLIGPPKNQKITIEQLLAG